MADKGTIASSAAGGGSKGQPGFTLAEGVLPESSAAELSNTFGDALAAMGVEGDVLSKLNSGQKPAEVGKPSKPRAREHAEADTTDETDTTDTDTDDTTTEGEADEAEIEADGDAEDTEAGAEDETEDTEDKDKDKDDEAKAKTPREKRRERFDRLTAKLRDKDAALAEKEKLIEELEQKLEATSSAKVQPTLNHPLADVEDEATLAQRVQGARQWQRWCMRHPEGGTPPGMEAELTPEQVESYLHWADAILDHADEHRETLRTRATKREEAVKLYPETFKRGSAEAQARADLLKQIPGLNLHPERDLLIGRLVRAMQQEAKEREGKGRYVWMPINPEARKANGNGSTSHGANGTNGHAKTPAKTVSERAPVQSANGNPRQKLWETAQRGIPVDAEALLMGGRAA